MARSASIIDHPRWSNMIDDLGEQRFYIILALLPLDRSFVLNFVTRSLVTEIRLLLLSLFLIPTRRYNPHVTIVTLWAPRLKELLVIITTPASTSATPQSPGSITSAPAVQTPPPLMPAVRIPDVFNGDRSKLEGFLISLEIYFLFNNHFSNELLKVIFAINYL